ncbi:MAG: alpha/beta fold hydrolase [Actinobacteria bacterium]|nr:alpha/beta fold hydrolase [Actinomycetota bacterium]
MTSRSLRAWSAAGISGTAALLAAAGGATWYYANRLTEPPALAWPPPPRADDEVRVEASGAAEVTLSGSGADRPGVWGLVWPDGYGRVGRVATSGDGGAVRPFTLLQGDPPGAGVDGALDAYAYPADPSLLGVAWEEVTYDSPVGPCPAWWFPGEAGTCVVMVHGRSARRHEAFRMLSAVLAQGLSALVISYRNDPDAPPSPDGRSHLGGTEWEDVEAAVRWALDHGADDVIPVGFSMGGACVVNFAALSPLAAKVRAMVLEAPVLDWGPVIRAAAIDRGLPLSVLPLLLPATMRLASARIGIDWAEMRHDPATFRHPKLLIHGAADATVPVELADAVAEARPDIVTYLRVPGAGHVRSWNTDPERYEATVREFLDVVG